MARTLKNNQLINIAYLTIPKDKRIEETINWNGDTNDIIKEIVRTDAADYRQTEKFAQRIAGPTIAHTLENLWKFIKYNVHYLVDELGIQKIKSPSSVWHTRICDCKGYALFVHSVLKNLKIVSHFKFAGYDELRDVTHVYIIVPQKNGGYTTIDGCMPGFNIEKPTTKIILI